MKKTLFLLIIAFMAGFSYGQEVPKSVGEIKVIAKPVNQKEVITNHLKQLFGEYFEMYGSSEEAQARYAEFYDRCEFLTADNIPAIVPNISSLMVKDKYNPNEIRHDNLSIFDVSSFNVFKYHLNFNSSDDLYYKIYNSKVVLKINKKTAK